MYRYWRCRFRRTFRHVLEGLDRADLTPRFRLLSAICWSMGELPQLRNDSGRLLILSELQKCLDYQVVLCQHRVVQFTHRLWDSVSSSV